MTPSLALVMVGILMGCSFATPLTPTPLTSTPFTPQTQGRVSIPSLDSTQPPYSATTMPSTATMPLERTTQPTEDPHLVPGHDNTRSVGDDGTGPTPNTQPSSPTPEPATGGQPLATPAPSLPPATPTPPGVSVYTGQVALLTYPYRDFLYGEQDALYGMSVQRLDRAAYQAASPRPSPQSYHALIVENACLRLTFLPELGGRLYSAVIKSTDQEIFYHNPVVKPSRYGPLLPIEDNWWLAVGGMEWAFPVQEHGYAWGLPWTHDVTHTPGGVTVALRDSTQPGRVRAEVHVTLPADSATFTIQPRLINDTDHTVPVQFWLNAALAPGSPSVTADTRFIVPVSQIIVHSRGEAGWDLPSPRSPMPWPVAADHDLSHYAQWANYLGFFIPYMQADFMGIYNPAADLSVARIVSPGQIPGHKLFAFGLNFGDRSYTDDNSQYVEMWGGANPGFWPEDDIQLAPGDAIEWRETWWPLTGLGGLTFANHDVAFNLLNGSALRILGARPGTATLVLSAGGVELLRKPVTLSPAHPIEQAIPTTDGPSIQIQIVAPDGSLIVDYQTLPKSSGSSL